jgi:hypothetical protein
MSVNEFDELSEAIELQRMTYGLLRWMVERMRQGTFAFSPCEALWRHDGSRTRMAP